MMEFLRKLFGQSGSSSTAKERLRLVLMTDHLALAPEMIDAMKRDLVDVISRYVEVDREKIEVNFEQQDKALAMLANIPILSVNRPSGDGGPPPPSPREREPEPEPAMSVAGAPNVRSPGAAHEAGADLPSRRRRRRRKAQMQMPGGMPAQPAPAQ